MIVRLLLTASLSVTVLAAACGGGLSAAEQHFNAGFELQEEGRLTEAILDYDEAIGLEPQFTQAYNNRGIAYDDLGQYQRAIQDFDEAIRLDPEFAEAYANRAIAHTLLGNDVEAKLDIDRAVGLGVDRGVLDGVIEEFKRQW